MRTAARCISSALLLLATASAAAPVSLSVLCPKAQGDDIIVCADPEPKVSPYRAPLRGPPEAGTRAATSVSRERNSLFDYDAGGSGLCSNVGPGGMYGCAFKSFKAGVEQRANAADYRGRIYDTPED